MEIQKRCKYCGRSFIAHKMNTIYCSPSCNNKDYKRAIRQKQIAEYMEEEKQKTPKVDILGGKEFLTPTEGALLLGLSRATFYRYMLNGTIKAVQLRGKTIVRRKDIERLFDNPPTYQSHSEKEQEKREYYTFRQIMEKFKCSKKTIMTRVENTTSPKFTKVATVSLTVLWLMSILLNLLRILTYVTIILFRNWRRNTR